MDKRTKAVLVVFVLLCVASVVVSYVRYMVEQNFQYNTENFNPDA